MALSDTIAARLATQRNPNLGTDSGINSTSPYFLATGSTGDTNAISDLASSWHDTSTSIAASQAAGAAKVKAAKDLAASQAAAAASQAQNDATAKAAQDAADTSSAALADMVKRAHAQATDQQKQLDAMRASVGLATSGGGGGTPVKTGASGSYSTKGGMDAQSQAGLAHARAMGYNLGAANYSKTYNSNPNLSAARNKAMMLATSYLGTRYALGGESHNSIDCSGLVQAVYQQLGFRVPTHSAADQGQTGGRSNGNGIPGQRVGMGSSTLKAGDIVAWRSGEHIAIFAGYRNGVPWIIEAANTKVGTVERPLWDSYGNVVGIHLNI